jgi:hypothetical protein
VVRATSIAVVLLLALAAPAQLRSHRPETAGLVFMPASSELLAACRRTARAVGYPVPCPTKVPHGLTETGANGPSGCALHVIGPGGIGGCPKSWRGWVVGSSDTPTNHLVITASPRPLQSYARVVNGPAWYPEARVKPLGWTTVGLTRMRAVFVPQGTNDGSAFANHVVLIWTVGRHTYGVGFHVVKSLRQTLLLDRELARHLRLVRP